MKSGERKYTKSSLPFSWLTWVIFSALVIVSPSLIAQECQCTNCPLSLPDVQSSAFIGYLQVEGATLNTLGGNNCVESVCIEISHDFIGDLAIFLTAPDGTTVVLFADGNGGIGFPYGNTGDDMNVCFTLPGASTNGSFAGTGGGNCTNPAYFMPCNGPTPCYSGTWEPWGQTCGAGGLNLFNNGTGTVNGVWTLTVYDNALVNQGVLENFEIQFCENDGITCFSIDCLADAGTVTSSFTGESITPTAICSGGSVSLISNDDYLLPSPGCGTCIPELIYAIYYEGGPTGPDPETDPNFTTWYWTGEDFTTASSGGFNQNNGGIGSLLSQIAPNPTNSWCFVPITADAGDLPNLDIDYDLDGCFDLGSPICFQFLNPIATSLSSSCNGSVAFTVTGGNPEFHGGNFSITNLGPGSLSTNSVAHGGSFSINGLTNGQTYSYSITAGGCTNSFSGVYSVSLSVTLNPPAATITPPACQLLNGNVNNSPITTSFSNTNDYIIPDEGIGLGNNNPTITIGDWIASPIIVSNICPNVLTPTSAISICMNIVHTFDGDLNIWLQTPSGLWLKLSDDNGGGGDNYTNTCFSTFAGTNITAGSAPFTGNYIPESPLSGLNGQSINGTWLLWIADDAFGDVGFLNDWSLTFSVTPTATYTWTPTTGLSSSTILSPTACPTSTTTYTLTGTNSCGCVLSASTTVTVNSTLTLSAAITASTDVLCYGENTGSATVTASDGLAPYSYSWDTSPAQLSQTATGLTAGTYTVTVTDANMTVTTASIVITEPASPLVIYAHGNDPSCSNLCDGSATVDAIGGTSPYSYLWSNGAITQSISALCENTYTVIVTDNNGCEYSAFVPTNDCFQIQAILVNSCSGNEWNEEMVFFQTGPNPLNTSSLTVTWPTLADSWRNLCTNPGYIAAVNATITNGGQVLPLPVSGILPANANVVLVTENVLSSPTADFSNLSGTLYMIFQCSGNTQGHFVNSGASANPLVLNFGGGCTQTVSYVPNSLPNYSSSSNGGYVLYSGSGTPSYLNYGCSIPFTIQTNSVTLTDPPPVNVAVSPTSTNICAGQNVVLTASGASTYSWSPATGLSATSGASVTASPTLTTIYTVTGTLNTCTNTATSTVTVAQLSNAGTNGSISVCASGSSVNLFASLGGSPATTGVWSGPSSLTGAHLGTFNPSTNSAGIYTYSVSGTSPCPDAIATITVTLSSGPLASFSYPNDPYCKNVTAPQIPTISGTIGGLFSSAPAGLSLNASTGAIVPSTSTAGTYTITYTIAASGGCAEFIATQSVVINDIPANPTLTPNPVCDGVATTLTAGNGSWYEFFVDGVSQAPPSATNTWLYSTPMSGSTACVRSYPPLPFTYEGAINEAAWGAPLATSAGGPVSGFAPNNNLDALYLSNSGGYLSGAVAGQTQNSSNNRILMFIDCAPGGFNNLGAWSNRTNAPYFSVENLSNDITFDPGFDPDYVLCMNQAGGVAFFDLYNMQANSNNYLGSDISSTLLGYQANGAQFNNTQGFEFAIPMNSLGNPSGSMKVFLMLVNDPGSGPPTFLSNQFLTRANAGESNYADGFVDFGFAEPNPISYSLSADCYSETCVTVIAPVVPVTNFTYTPRVCSTDPDISPSPNSGFTIGGIFTSTAGLSINASTGLIDVSASTPGTYTITYSIPASGCNPAGSSTFSVTIDPLPLTTPIFHE